MGAAAGQIDLDMEVLSGSMDVSFDPGFVNDGDSEIGTGCKAAISLIEENHKLEEKRKEPLDDAGIRGGQPAVDQPANLPPSPGWSGDMRGGGLPCCGCQRFESAYLQLVIFSKALCIVSIGHRSTPFLLPQDLENRLTKGSEMLHPLGHPGLKTETSPVK
ncbi:hypothetical protein HAX54_014957 [Datura stramonium]|uniref:Uncharacterized protein n=1 Tax=Datura stramonium TaxID=4076 RepID=A0ABS8TP33_DATST|nr:hypothetical protein [Datura stramonium]